MWLFWIVAQNNLLLFSVASRRDNQSQLFGRKPKESFSIVLPKAVLDCFFNQHGRLHVVEFYFINLLLLLLLILHHTFIRITVACCSKNASK